MPVRRTVAAHCSVKDLLVLPWFHLVHQHQPGTSHWRRPSAPKTTAGQFYPQVSSDLKCTDLLGHFRPPVLQMTDPYSTWHNLVASHNHVIQVLQCTAPVLDESPDQCPVLLPLRPRCVLEVVLACV
jgi:hypothetical protein